MGGERDDGGIRWDGGCQLATWLLCMSGDVLWGIAWRVRLIFAVIAVLMIAFSGG